MSRAYTAREKVCPIHDPSEPSGMGKFSGIGLQHGGHGLLARCAAHARAGTGHGAAWKEIHEENKQLNEGYNLYIPLAIPTLKWGSRDPKPYKFYTDQSCSKIVGHISQEYELTKIQTNKKGVFHSVSILERTTVGQKCSFWESLQTSIYFRDSDFCMIASGF